MHNVITPKDNISSSVAVSVLKPILTTPVSAVPALFATVRACPGPFPLPGHEGTRACPGPLNGPGQAPVKQPPAVSRQNSLQRRQTALMGAVRTGILDLFYGDGKTFGNTGLEAIY